MRRKKSAPSQSGKRSSMARWIRKYQLDEENDLNSPVPMQIVSNEEFIPINQTERQKQVQHKLVEMADHNAKLLGLTRRRFLQTTGGMATAFIAMNSVFGKVFDVDASEMLDPSAYSEKWPKNEFIFDIQTHHVAPARAQMSMNFLLGMRRVAERWNPALRGHKHQPEDLLLANYVKEIFFDSDTTMAVISGFPDPVENTNILPPAKMIETRAQINGLAHSRRIVSHGLFSPDLGAPNLESMHKQAEEMKVEAWKGYTGWPSDRKGVGWWMDDEKVAYPTFEYARKIGIKTICIHKGLPLVGFNVEHCDPKDVPKAAADFPDLNFIIYHSAFKGFDNVIESMTKTMKGENGIKYGMTETGYVPWVSDLCAARKKNPKMKNVYMEIGATFGMLAITDPVLCAHVLGMMIDAFGDDHIMWGTDAIWSGSPQWQIEAMRRIQMPEELTKKFGWKPLTPQVKAKIFGLNAARIYGVDVKAKRNALPSDALEKLKAEYRQQGPMPSNTQYGWVRGK